MIQAHSALSPVFDRSLMELGVQTVSIDRFVFGSQLAKPKWISCKDKSA